MNTPRTDEDLARDFVGDDPWKFSGPPEDAFIAGRQSLRTELIQKDEQIKELLAYCKDLEKSNKEWTQKYMDKCEEIEKMKGST